MVLIPKDIKIFCSNILGKCTRIWANSISTVYITEKEIDQKTGHGLPKKATNVVQEVGMARLQNGGVNCTNLMIFLVHRIKK